MTPETIGLDAYSGVTSKFRKLRRINPKCPHKGLDISSGGKKVDFIAGIFGRVDGKGGDWNTISVKPLDGSALLVQYLHCSLIYVDVGDIVYPWTTLGKTGNVGSRDVHMHLQIKVPLDGSEENCWKQKSTQKARNFTDPEKYIPGDLLRGFWEFKSDKLRNSKRVRETKISQIQISGWKVGNLVQRRETRELIFYEHNCSLSVKKVWNDAVMHHHSARGFELSFSTGKASHATNCHFPDFSPTADAGVWSGKVINWNEIKLGEGRWMRVSKFSI